VVKVAVAQAVAVRHIRDAGEKVFLSALVEKLGCGNIEREPDFEAGELDRRMGMDTHVQAHHTLEISGSVV
jgi:hypothetical protein